MVIYKTIPLAKVIAYVALRRATFVGATHRFHVKNDMLTMAFHTFGK
jgi:hypothetical protein